jgi:antitoxin component of RelBE/YafQ-DinJ toxin-antitoxin module
MSRTATARARVEPDLKENVEPRLHRLVCNATDAIRLFYGHIRRRQGPAFPVELPNEATRRTFEATDKMKWRSLLRYGGLAILCLMLSTNSVQGQAMIIDHTCTDINKIPGNYLEKSKTMFQVAYGHTSHGSQIVSGMKALRKSRPDLFGFGRGDGKELSLFDRTPGGDLGNPDRKTWAQRTRELLNGGGRERNLIVWSWCGQVSSASEEDIRTYLDLMSGLEKEFPKVTFVYMTGHLDGSGKNGNLNKRNEQIRKFCRENGKILFDFADIESFDPDGKVNYMELHAKDSCDYMENGVVRNWADEWLKRNPEHGIALPVSAAHSKPLNGALKGRAFWWMLARLAGWDGKPYSNK